jgi:hypothetical protein
MEAPPAYAVPLRRAARRRDCRRRARQRKPDAGKRAKPRPSTVRGFASAVSSFRRSSHSVLPEIAAGETTRPRCPRRVEPSGVALKRLAS